MTIGTLAFAGPIQASASSSNWNVQVGNESAFSGANRFYLNDITVHPGDTVTFNFNGLHTVTFNPPPNLSLFDYIGFNGPPPGSSVLDTPSTFVNGAAALFGAPQPFVLTIGNNLPAGTYHYTCRFHQFMTGEIHVTNGPLPSTDAQNQALASAQMAADTADAAALDARLTKESTHKNGRAFVGQGTKTFEFVKYYPSNISVKTGQELTFTDEDLHEPHTVSFGAIGNPADPFSAVYPLGSPNGYDGTSPLNSGFMFHQSQYEYWNLGVTPISAAVPRTTFSVTFTKPGTYNFYCAIHGGYDPATGQVFGMSGSITVLPEGSG